MESTATQPASGDENYTPQAMTFTDTAAQQIRNLLESDAEMSFLRVKVVGGGCSGYSYDMFLDNETAEGDIITDRDGVRVVVDEMSLTFMEGTELDYIETLTQAGFKFNNPQAEDTCGCGISFKA